MSGSMPLALLLLFAVFMQQMLQGAAQEGCPTPPPDDLYYNIQWQGSCGGTGSLIAVNGNCQGTCKSARSFVQGTLYVYCSGNPPKWNRGLIDLGPYICLEACIAANSPPSPWICPQPAVWPDSTKIHAHGWNCTLACDTAGGFDIEEGGMYANATKQCREGVWEDLASCKQTCTNPPLTLENVNWGTGCQTSFSRSNKACNGTCTSSTKVREQVQATCNEGNWGWSTPQSCEPEGCASDPTPMDHVSWSCSTAAATPHGSNCTGTCDQGYSQVPAQPVATCSSGVWDLSGGCQPSSCPNTPTGLANVTWGCATGPFLHDSSCSGTCVSGYSQGPAAPEATCRFGEWILAGGCQPSGCSQRPSGMDNIAAWNCPVAPSHGGNCTGTCAAGHSPVPAAPQATCGFGRWSLSGGCQPSECSGPPAPVANVKWGCDAATFPHRQNCVGTCINGTVPIGGGPVATCSLGVWKTVDGGCAQPTAQNCTVQPVSNDSNPNAYYECALPTPSGGRCTGRCVWGVAADLLWGPPLMTCINGNWSHTSGNCTACPSSTLPNWGSDASFLWDKQCRAVAAHPDGYVCQGACEPGFELNQATIPRTRCAGGWWHHYYVNGSSVSFGKCDRIPGCKSPPPANLSNGTTWDSCILGVAHDESCAGDCSEGYKIDTKTGRPVALCQRGAWKLAQGACTVSANKTCAGSALPRNDTFSWPVSCRGSATADRGSCIANCTAGYLWSKEGPPTIDCTDGTWGKVNGGCDPLGCFTEPAGFNQASFYCIRGGSPVQHGQNCTGMCTNSTVTTAPVVNCRLGQWVLVSGTCNADGSPMYFDVSAKALTWQELEDIVRSGKAEQYLKEGNAAVVNFIRAQIGFLALLSRFSHALTEHFNGAIIEFNKRFDGARVMSEEVERGTLKVVPIFKTEMEESQSEIVQVLKQQLTPTIMQQLAPSAVAFAASSGLLSPSFDFSQVSVGLSDAEGNVQPGSVITPENCYVAVETDIPALRAMKAQHAAQRGFMTAQATLPNPELCPGATTLEASFPYRTVNAKDVQFSAQAYGSEPDASPQVDAPAFSCSLKGAGNTDGTLMVTCKSVNGKPLPAGLNYTIEVSSRYKCSDSQISASSVALRKVKNPVGLSTWHQGTGRTLVCADAGKATTTFNYRLTDDGVVKQAVLSATASSSIQGVTCTTNIGKGEDMVQSGRLVTTGTVEVVCSGPLKVGSSMDIRLTMKATPNDCRAATKTIRKRVTLSCCKTAVSYARPDKVGSRSGICFQHHQPGIPRSRCRSNTAPVVYGTYNQGPGKSTLTVMDPNDAKCKASRGVGSVVMTCDARNNKLASFTVTSNSADTRAVQYVMVTCQAPKGLGDCPGSIAWTKVNKRAKKVPTASGDGMITTITAALPADASCTCQEAVWAVSESAKYLGLAAKHCSV